MDRIVTYCMTPVSPWTWLGHDRLRAICARQGATIDLKLIDLGTIFPASGGLALKDRAPQRQAYRLQELARWRDFLGVPLNLQPKHFPVSPLAAATVILAVQQRHGTEAALDVAGDCLRTCWVDQGNIAEAGTLAALLRARGFDADPLLLHAASAEIAERYREHTQVALAAGVFGSPSYLYGGQLYWGQDRLDFLERALAQ